VGISSAELQRARTALQGIHASYGAEIKKKEKEMERVIEKWQKLVDSRMRCPKVAPAVDRKCQGDLETSLTSLTGPSFTWKRKTAAEKVASQYS